MAYSGHFKPKNRDKYKGDPTQIVYRSHWEKHLMTYLDTHPDIVYWISEGVAVPYRSVIDGLKHTYWPDFVVKFRDKTGKEKIVMIEVKPHGQTQPPVRPENPKKSRKYIKEVVTYGVNTSKWKSAQAYCKERGWEFILITEEHEPRWKL